MPILLMCNLSRCCGANTPSPTSTVRLRLFALFRRWPATTRDMMRDVFDRCFLAAAIAIAAIGMASPAHADPQCPATGCPHGQANNPPPANANSPSYKDGYKTEHDYFAVPQNHAYLASEMRTGYTAAL